MISYRRLVPAESNELIEHFSRLSCEDRSLRFFAAIGDEGLAKYVKNIKWPSSVIIGAFEGGRLRGVVEIVKTDNGADLAVSVEADYQGRGIGSELVRRALLAAQNLNWGHVRVECLLRNEKMKKLARRYSLRVHFEDGEAVADIDLPSRDYISLSKEFTDETLGWFSDLTNRFVRFA